MSGCLPCFGKQKKYQCEPEPVEREKTPPTAQEPNQNEPIQEEPKPLSPTKAELKAAFFAESPQPNPTTDPFKEKAEKAAQEKEQKAKAQEQEGEVQATVVKNVESTPAPLPEGPNAEEKIAKLKEDLENLPEGKTEQFCLQALRVVKSLQNEQLSDAMAADLNNIVGKLESLVTRLESVTVRAEGSGGAGDDDNANVQAFDDQIIGGKIKDYFRLSKEIGGDVDEHAQLFKVGLNILRGLLVDSGKYKQPTQADMQTALKPLSTQVNQVQDFAEKRRNTKMDTHLRTVKEAVPVVGWVTVMKPGNYIKEIKDQAMFYGNRVLKDYKGKDEKHVEWWRALCAALTEMEQFVKDCYPMGLTWNPQGISWSPSAAPPPPPPAGGAPPPPPPPAVLPPTTGGGSKGDADQAARANLFASLQQGTDITKGLKKVSKDQMTHKNPALRAGATVPDKPTPAAKPAAAPAAAKKTGTPRCQLEGKKWIVEHQSNNQDLVVEGDQKQTVYVYKCDNSTLQIKGKLNSIVVDGCSKMGIVVEDVISTVDFINCQRVKGQVMGKIPCMNIDKTDGIEVYLSKDSVQCEIVTAKSSAMNILVPKDDDFVEYPLPEQFKCTWNGKGFTTTATEST